MSITAQSAIHIFDRKYFINTYDGFLNVFGNLQLFINPAI